MIYTITTQTKPIILENSYKGGKRMTKQQIEFTKADDLRIISGLYAQLAAIEDSYMDNYISVDSYTQQREYLEGEIAEYKGYVDGYDASKADDSNSGGEEANRNKKSGKHEVK